MSLERIDKILSHEGFGTRKDVKRLLRFSSVTVNGTQITAPDFHCDVDNDEICVDGKVLSLQHNIHIHFIIMYRFQIIQFSLYYTNSISEV